MGIRVGGGGAGSGAIFVDTLPVVDNVRRDQLYQRRSDRTLWARGGMVVAAVDAVVTSVGIDTILIASHTWYDVASVNPYPAADAGVYYNSSDATFYLKAAGSLAGSMTTGTPAYDSAYNFRGVSAADPTGTHADDDIYFNTTDGNWYIYAGLTYTVVADPASLFDETNPVWLGPPLDTQAEILQHFYTTGNYVAADTYIFYDSAASSIAEITAYTATTTDWAASDFESVTTRTGALTLYANEAAAISDLNANGYVAANNYGYIDGSDIDIITAFTAAIPVTETPTWEPVSSDLVRGPGMNQFADATARDAALTGADLTPYENNDHLLIGVGTEVQRYVNSAWEQVDGWIVGEKGDIGPAPPALTKAQIEDASSNVAGTMTGRRMAEGTLAHEAYPWDVIFSPTLYRDDPSDISPGQGGFSFEVEAGATYLKVRSGSHNTAHMEALIEHGEAVVLEPTHHDEIFRMEFLADWDDSENRIEVEVRPDYASLLTDGDQYELGFTQGRPDIGITSHEAELIVQAEVAPFARTPNQQMPLDRYGAAPVTWLNQLELYGRAFGDVEAAPNFVPHTVAGQDYVDFKNVAGNFISGLAPFTLIGISHSGEAIRRGFYIITGDFDNVNGYPVTKIGFDDYEADRDYDVYFSVAAPRSLKGELLATATLGEGTYADATPFLWTVESGVTLVSVETAPAGLWEDYNLDENAETDNAVLQIPATLVNKPTQLGWYFELLEGTTLIRDWFIPFGQYDEYSERVIVTDTVDFSLVRRAPNVPGSPLTYPLFLFLTYGHGEPAQTVIPAGDTYNFKVYLSEN